MSSDKLVDDCTVAKDCDQYLVGLYPEYIKSWSEFQDANNNAKVGDPPVTPAQTHLCTGTSDDTDTADCGASLPGTLVLMTGTNQKSFYTADAYDVSPHTSSSNSLDSTYILRYQTSWTSISKALDCTEDTSGTATSENFCKSPNNPSADANLYTNQLRWRNPSSITYVTSTTYHVPQASIVLVLMQDGSVKKIDAAKYHKYDGGPIALDGNGVVGGTGANAANFWQVTL